MQNFGQPFRESLVDEMMGSRRDDFTEHDELVDTSDNERDASDDVPGL